MPQKDECHYIPTPEEIVAECQKIREGWSEDKWSNQRQAVPWSLPQITDPAMGQDRIE